MTNCAVLSTQLAWTAKQTKLNTFNLFWLCRKDEISFDTVAKTATISKQHSTSLKGRYSTINSFYIVAVFLQQSRTLLRHCCWCGRGYRSWIGRRGWSLEVVSPRQWVGTHSVGPLDFLSTVSLSRRVNSGTYQCHGVVVTSTSVIINYTAQAPIYASAMLPPRLAIADGRVTARFSWSSRAIHNLFNSATW